MRPKKILFVYGIYSIHAEKRMKIFLEDQRFEIAVISRFDYSSKGIRCFKMNDYRDNIKYNNTSLLFRGLMYLKQLFSHFIYIKKVVKQFSPDVIFLQTLLYPAVLIFLQYLKTPIIITFWNGDVIWWAKWDFLEKLFKYQIVKKGINRANIITVNSNFAKECCKKYYADDKKIHVLPYPGIDRSIFHPLNNKELLRKKYNVNSEYIFFCPRGLASYLNNEQILRALSKLQPVINFTVIYLIGNSTKDLSDQFNALVKKFGLVDKVKIIDKLNPFEMAEVYSISDITLSLSSNDSQPNCMLESMSCGTIVLMGDLPQIREWIVDNETGILCEIGNSDLLAEKISFILSNSILVDKIIENSTNIIENRADLQKSKNLIKELVINV